MSGNQPDTAPNVTIKKRWLKQNPAMFLYSLLGAAIGLGYAIYTDPNRQPPPPPPQEQAMSSHPAAEVFSGIGIELRPAIGGATIYRLFPGTTAAQSGMQPGDLVTAVDGISVAQKTVADIYARLRGVAGSGVTITYTRNGGAPQQVTLKRELLRTGKK